MYEICSQEKCTGCSACLCVCNHKAISLIPDSLGFLYPQVNPQLCVNCGLCRKVCPNNCDVYFNFPQRAFIAFAKDIDEQYSSASGGIASVLARYVIRSGGIVYGCSGYDCYNVRHIRIDNEKEISLLKGSKYVQSYLGDIFKLVRRDLKDNIKFVLFIGTPCQISGLNSFLGRKYENLLTADFVCHGVPSQKILNDSVRIAHEYNIKNVSLAFRRKSSSGRVSFGIFMSGRDNQKLWHEQYPKNLYITGFLQGLFYRSSCYKCNYTKINRVADFTLGDYWDYDNSCHLSNQKKGGLSMLMINTKKGEDLLHELRDYINIQDIDVNCLCKRNRQLMHPVPQHRNYELFKEYYLKYGFRYAANKTLKKDILVIYYKLFKLKLCYLKRLTVKLLKLQHRD